MIGRLEGAVLEHDPAGGIVIDVGGVGYEVVVTDGALGRASNDSNGHVTLYVHTHVREDALVLYGFASLEDRAAFRALLGVSSIGPKLAMAILAQMNAHELAAAVTRHDKAAFKGISGVGRKTVERLLVDLQDKLGFGQPSTTGLRPKTAPALEGSTQNTVVGALIQLGYRRPEAESAVRCAAEQAEPNDVEQLLRAALSSLG